MPRPLTSCTGPSSHSPSRRPSTSYLDRSSVEVFAQGGTTITDQVFPSAGSDGIGLFAKGGTAQLDKLTVTPLAPSMFVSGG
ncbi:GH32 C-terminal domain-containing protein [Nostocoides jenkinsii]|uniref:GH32 C-terminal domain-containing protein n=1 Tax=Nostocoides jenkinsii TaxID=330834 RepID=UPI0022860327|nr:GH32 C-terminal domain-containing protein [Tetrasphaera jenkinsii]